MSTNDVSKNKTSEKGEDKIVAKSFDLANFITSNQQNQNVEITKNEIEINKNTINVENFVNTGCNLECNYVSFCEFKFPILKFNNVARHRKKMFGIMIKTQMKENNIIKYAHKLENYKNSLADVTIYKTNDLFILKYKLNNMSDFASNERFICQELNILENDFSVFSIPDQNKKSFKNLFKDNATTIYNSLTSDYMGKILSGENDETTTNCLELCLSYSISKLPFNYINEHMCSFTVMLASMGFSVHYKDNMPNNTISFAYSFEKHMSGNIIRVCDGIYVHKNRLSVLEFKNNVSKKENPLKYSKDREYIKYVLEYFYKNEPEMLNSIEFVCYLGIEFFGEDKGFEVKVTTSEVFNVKELINKNDVVLTKTKLRRIKDKHNKKFKLQKFKSTKNDTHNHLVKQFSKHNIKQIVKFYKFNFTNFNSSMREWVENFKNIGIVYKNKIIGSLTYNLTKFPFECLDVALISTDVSFRLKGIGKQLIKALPIKKIVVWSDNESVEFYEKMSFVKSEELGLIVKSITTYCYDSVFMYFGLTELELEMIRIYCNKMILDN